MALWKKVLIGLIVFIASIGIIGFFILPAVIKPLATDKLSVALHRLVTIEQVILNPEEYEKYLTLAYDAGKIPKPWTSVWSQKKLPKEEMGKLIMTNISITDGDLRQLATLRAGNIKELILKFGDVKTGRIFIVEPKALLPAKKDKVKSSRSNYKVK